MSKSGGRTLALYERIRQSEAKLVGPDGRGAKLPDSLDSFLCQLLADLAEGKSISIVEAQAELTTVDAARLLGVSRQFFVNLLERGELPYHKVGTHRRVYVRHVLAYKAKRDGMRKKVLDELVQAEVDEGLYDLVGNPASRDADRD